MKDVIWTAREALACAYCWAEFHQPEMNGFSSPEAYWCSISEAARNDCRRVANERMLLAVARGQAEPMAPPLSWSDDTWQHVAAHMRLKTRHKVERYVHAVWLALRMKAGSGG